jgi:hypothetical protein
MCGTVCADQFSCGVVCTIPQQTVSGRVAGRERRTEIDARAEAWIEIAQSRRRRIRRITTDMRAFLLWRASYAYTKLDPKHAEKLSRDAFRATQAIEDASDNDHCAALGDRLEMLPFWYPTVEKWRQLSHFFCALDNKIAILTLNPASLDGTQRLMIFRTGSGRWSSRRAEVHYFSISRTFSALSISVNLTSITSFMLVCTTRPT